MPATRTQPSQSRPAASPVGAGDTTGPKKATSPTAITGVPQVNTVGYCIAGTTLALTLGYLAKKGDPSVRSATFFTTLTDFSDPGEFLPFLQDDFVDGIARQVAQDGVLDRFFMARTFSYLRPSDLVYQPAVRRYLMGEPPPAFDLLYCCLLYTSPSPRDGLLSRMPSSA